MMRSSESTPLLDCASLTNRDEATKELKGYKGNDFVTDVSFIVLCNGQADNTGTPPLESQAYMGPR